MKKLIAFALIGLSLIGCSRDQNQYVEYKPNYQQIRIDRIKRPKHFKITYTIVSTGQQITKSNKHCNDWSRVTVGKYYTADINLDSGCEVIRSIHPKVIY